MKPTNKLFIIYKAVSPSNKIYIGITSKSLSDRKSVHKYDAIIAKKDR